MRVSLITTGEMEFRGLAASLKRLFPDHDFYAEPMTPGRPFHGFTGARVRPLAANDPPGISAQLLRAALGTVAAPGASPPDADLSIVVEDLELVNKGNEATVVNHVRDSATRLVQEMGSASNPVVVRGLLRERVSFHLAVPMPESWFFGDLSALATEVQSQHLPPVLAANRDLEDFLAVDPAFLADNGSGCSTWIAGGSKPFRSPRWLIARRAEHPKAYLAWLTRDPMSGDCSRYKETKEGVRLLGRMCWSTVLGNLSGFAYLRALVRDLESALGTTAVGVGPGGVEAVLTRVGNSRPNPILRNL
jgi:hypothetical protein